MISRSFLKSSLVFTIGGALPMLASIILLPFYTNLLQHSQYLQVAFYINVSLLFQVLFSYALESYFGIEYTRLHEDHAKQKRFTGTVFFLLLIIGGLLLLLSAICGDWLFGKIFKSELDISFWPYGFYSVLTAFFNAFFKTATICLIYTKQARVFLAANIINFIATLAISIGGIMIWPDSIIGPMYGRLLSGLIIFLMAMRIFSANGTLTFDKEFLPELYKFCTPYLLFALSAWVLGQIDRYFLQKYLDVIDLNAYDLILKCFFGIEFLQNSLSAIIFPQLYRIWTQTGERATTKESNRYFNVFTAVNIILLILFCIGIPFVYQIFIKKAGFERSEPYIGVLAAGYALRSILNFYLSTILFTKSTKVLLQIFSISAIIQIGITALAVPFFGLMGAIYTGLITRIIQILLSMGLTKRIFRYEYNYFKILFIPAFFIVVNILQYQLFKVYNVWFYAAEFLAFSILFFLVFRNEIRIVFNQYLKKSN